MPIKSNIAILLGTLLSSFFELVWAQQNVIPLNFQIQNEFEFALTSNKEVRFTALRPFLLSDFDSINVIFPHYNSSSRDSILISKFSHPMWWRKFRTDDLIDYNNEDFELKINPIFNFSLGKDQDKNSIYHNTRGIDISGSLGSEFSFGTGMYENQSVFPDYYSDWVKTHHVVYGQGRARTFKTNGYDYSYAYGYLSYSPTKAFNFRMGHGKNFIGEGYRSLILSDVSMNMPFAMWTTTVRKIRYTNLLLAYQNIGVADGLGEIANRRYGSITMIDFSLFKFLELGLVESNVWPRKNSNSAWPSLNYFNPIIFTRTLGYGLNSEINSLLGLNSKVRIGKHINAYFQWIYDKKNQYGVQFGAKIFKPFNLPVFLQMEYNQVQPYTYAHFDKQSFTHYNQALAHPYGANFTEWIGRASFYWKDFTLSYHLSLAHIAQDTGASNVGQDIFLFVPDEQSNNFEQGLDNQLLYQDVKLSFMINPKSRMELYVQFCKRQNMNELDNSRTLFWLFGLKTGLTNLYYDF